MHTWQFLLIYLITFEHYAINAATHMRTQVSDYCEKKRFKEKTVLAGDYAVV